VPEPSEVDALYVQPPDQFIAARAALVKQMRANGERVEAQRIAKLRRPSAAAWALNQVARTAPGLITDLLAAGATLRRATIDAMSGEASGLRGAEAGERAAVDAILSWVAGDTGPPSEVQRRRMVETLRAAVLDEGVAASLGTGTLDSDHEAPPFGFEPVPDTAPTVKQGTRTRVPADQAAAAREQARQAAREQARQAEIARLQADADRLAQQAERLDRDAADAELRARDLRAKAKDAMAASARAGEKLASARDAGTSASIAAPAGREPTA
jgi:hypothetical protein